MWQNLPEELKSYPNWVCWGRAGSEGRNRKIPYNPLTGSPAKANDPETWARFADASEAVRKGLYAGVGFEFGNSPFVGIDFDHCIDAGTEAINPQVEEWVRRLGSYAEKSQSGSGLHIIVRGETPGHQGFKRDWAEVYDTGRYFALTGDTPDPLPIADGGEALQALIALLSKPERKDPGGAATAPGTGGALAWNASIGGLPDDGPPVLADGEILSIARRAANGADFQTLYDGNWEGKYPSQSEADLALCNKLAFYTADPGQIDRLFRGSGLYREKWDVIHDPAGKRTYGQTTIDKAIAGTPNHYRGRVRPEEAFSPITGGSPQAGDPEKKRLKVISAKELAVKDIPPVQWVVVDLIPHGLSLLVGPSKFGKSWFVLDMCLSIAAGSQFLTFRTNKSGCLYLALEDTEARLKNRMLKVLAGKEPPDHFDYSTSSSSIAGGLLEELDDYLQGHPETGFIVIDTLQKVRDGGKSGDTAYTADYREMGALKEFADKHRVSLLLVHHTRKMADDTDDYNKISGSTGIMGAADTILLMKREKRQSDATHLLITGRDIESSDLVLSFDKSVWKWKFLGNHETFEEMRVRAAYESDPVVRTCRALVKENPNGWSGSAKDFLTFGEQHLGAKPEATSQVLNKRLRELEMQLKEWDGIVHRETPHGTAGNRHWIYPSV